MTDDVERVARAIWDVQHPSGTTWDDWEAHQAKNPGAFDGRDECRRLARAAIAALTASSGWRTIDSAPKDGTRFDAWCQPEDYPNGWRIADVVWEPRYDAFFSDDDGILGADLTHWQPLPTPPGTEQPPSNEDAA